MSRMPKRDPQFNDLVADSKAQQAARDLEIRKRAEHWKLPNATKAAIFRAGFGTPEQPVGVDVVVVPIDQWAAWIVEAARAWKLHPGMEVIEGRKLLLSEPEIIAGHRVFKFAARGATSAAVARVLGEIRSGFGPKGLEGVVAFLQHLHDGYDRETWSSRRWVHVGFGDPQDDPNHRPEAQTTERETFKVASKRIRRPRARNPDPRLDDLQQAVEELQAGSPDEEIGVEEVKRLYGLGTMSVDQFRKSTKYEALTGEHENWQLPMRKRPAGRSSTGGFSSSVTWRRGEVLTAAQGWIDRLSGEDPSPF